MADTQIAMIPTPGMGHLIPQIQFAKQLIARHRFSITFLIPTDGSPTKSQLSVLKDLPPSISHRFLSPADTSDIPADARIETRIILTLIRSIPALRDSLKTLSESTRLAAAVFDPFGGPVLTLAEEVGVLPYIYYTCSALCLCSAFHLPTLDKTTTCEYRELPEPVLFFPGCVPVRGVDLIDPAQDRKDAAYRNFLDLMREYSKAAGIIINSFVDLEPEALKASTQYELGKTQVYPVGPLVRKGNEPGSDSCLRWLDEQPSGSVLYVSFGSGGTLSRDQITELACGLEMSQQRFLWVFKAPNDKAVNGTYFDQKAENDPSQFLPDGFLERTKSVGLVVSAWVPQAQILGHGSTGGFLSHCGWNSILEGIVNGVAFICWPLFAEQRLNAVQLTDDLKVAFRVEHNQGGLVDRGQIAGHVRRLIEGEEGKVLRGRMGVLKAAAEAALGEEGSSTKNLDELAQIWKA